LTGLDQLSTGSLADYLLSLRKGLQTSGDDLLPFYPIKLKKAMFAEQIIRKGDEIEKDRESLNKDIQGALEMLKDDR
jgi:hypothetical protein